MLRAVLIATSLVASSSTFAQQVRVISGDIEHVYGPGGDLLDDADQQARNQRAWEHMQAEKQLAIQRRQLDIETERLKLQQAAIATGMAQSWDGMAPNWDSTDGGWFIGSTGAISPRLGQRFFPRIGSHRVGGLRR
jgi:hypothetical protein